MSPLSGLFRRHTVRYLALLFVLAAALFALRFGVHRVEDGMRATPERLPPAWQIRLQRRDMGRSVVPDDELGFLLQPNSRERVESPDFTFTRVLDEHGFPNPAPWPDRADIVFLGDSFLLGEGVGVERGFVARIDEALPEVSIVNLGNPGAGPERQYRIYRRFGAPLEPSWVVVCLFLAYDLENDHHFFSWLEDPLGMEYDEYRLSYVRRNDPPSELSRRLERHPLYGWMQALIEPRLAGNWWTPHRVVTSSGGEIFLDRETVRTARKRFSGEEIELRRARTSLHSLTSDVEAQGGRVMVMLLPSKEEAHAIPPGGESETAPAHMRAWLEENGVEYLDLYPALRARREQAAYFKLDIHFNALGNELVAQEFLRWWRHTRTSNGD